LCHPSTVHNPAGNSQSHGTDRNLDGKLLHTKKMTSQKNEYCGRTYTITQGYHYAISLGGSWRKAMHMNLDVFDFNPIQIDRTDFARLLRRNRKNKKQ
jgi:hypothetical protein